jgi:putative ABC transport system ATP-binding protein
VPVVAASPVPVIALEGVTKTYTMGDNVVKALNDVALTVARGEMIAIMGASGSGKSTLMNILGCLDVPTSGTYRLDGQVVNGLSRNELADLRNAKLGFVFQGFNLLARTSALDNVELPLLYRRGPAEPDSHARAVAALTRVGLAERMDHQPGELSGGQQQRVAIARAMVTSPTLLLADEPTGNLDSKTSVEVMAIFQELNEQGITLLIVTHEPDVARYAKRIVEVRDGKIIRDHAVTARRSAKDDLAGWDARPPESDDTSAVDALVGAPDTALPAPSNARPILQVVR